MKKNILKRIQRRIIYFFQRCRWPFYVLRGFEGNNVGDNCSESLVVSLTSYPKRIDKVHIVIKSLLMQSKKTDRLILWLAVTDFPKREVELPSKLTKLKKYGLEIMWCEDIGSYKKFIPTLKMFPGAVIITVDDDVFYRKNTLADLCKLHKEYPECICANRVTKFSLDKSGEFVIESGGYEKWREPSFLNKLTGCAGVLYPVNSLYKDILDENIFMKECRTNDDIWFWLMGVLNGTRVIANSNEEHLLVLSIPGTQKNIALSEINDRGEKLFWKDFNAMLLRYPELNIILKKEYERMLAIGK